MMIYKKSDARRKPSPGVRLKKSGEGTEGGTTKKRCNARTYRGVRRIFNKWRKKRPQFQKIQRY